MKKISLLLVIFAIITVSLFAQPVVQAEKNPAARPVSGDFEALQTANSLARYGYSAKSPSALIGAAEILIRIKTQTLGEPKAQSQSASTTTPEFTPANLLADARKMAGKDKTMTAWADEVEKLLKGGTRGAAGGPKEGGSVVAAGSVAVYSAVFRPNELAEVLVVGDGSTVLDIFIYDAAGKLLLRTDVNTFDAYLNWVPRSAVSVDIVVKNWGNRPNRFQIFTN
jgi:hypothetical protein